MNLEILSKIKSKLSKYLSNKEILDIIVFGSVIKGKSLPNDFDIAIISEKELNFRIEGFHISFIRPIDFFIKSPSIVNTLLREGYSLKYNKFLAECYGFSSKVLFTYNLSSLTPSNKVKIVNFLHGKNKEMGLVEQNRGIWLANQVFTIPIGSEVLFDKFFINFKVKFNKSYLLIH